MLDSLYLPSSEYVTLLPPSCVETILCLRGNLIEHNFILGTRAMCMWEKCGRVCVLQHNGVSHQSPQTMDNMLQKLQK